MATYLTSNTGTATNAKKFTYSVWLKRSAIDTSASQRFYQGYKDSNNRFYAYFVEGADSNEDRLWIFAVTGGTEELYWVSNRRFRDINAWYHIVFSADSTQASQGDRFKVYVNGVEETSWTKNSNPSQNIDWGNQLAQTNNDLTISGTESQSQPFFGLMSHINFIDGTAYPASSFGSTDSVTGEWQINTSPNVTYGNNGFFILKDGNSVTDQSGNSNNFTVASGTLTKTEDNPSNVFATLNPLDNPYVGQIATFSNGNTTGQSTETGHLSGASTIGVSTGKYYVEIKPTNGNVTYSGIGVMTDPISGLGSTPIHDSGKLYGIRGNGTKITGSSTTSSWSGSYTTNDILGLALDLDNNRLYISKNGQYADGSGNFDEAFTGSPAYVTLASNQTYFFVGGSLSTGSGHYLTIQANFGNGYFGTTAVATNSGNGYAGAEGKSIFNYQPPTGYSALSTRGLNE